MTLSRKDIEQREMYLNKIFILFEYLFLGIIIGNIGEIFMGISTEDKVCKAQDSIFQILGIFFTWTIIPAIGLLRIGKKQKDKIIKSRIGRMLVPRILFGLNIIMGIFILVCIAVDIQNTVIDPTNPINTLEWISSLF